MPRQFLELGRNFFERQPESLCEDDERNSTQHCTRESPVSRGRALGMNEAARFVKAQRRSCNAAAPGDVADRES